MPEWLLGVYARMLPRLEAEQRQQQIADALYVGARQMSDSDRRGHARQLQRQAHGAAEQIRAPKLTLAQAERWGFKISGGEEVSK